MNIIVPTCAAYSDAWIPFFTLFFKFWPDCPYPITLVTDHLAPEAITYRPPKPVEVIEVGQDLGWCKNFLHGLEKIHGQPEFVLMLQEDFWLNAPPNAAYIERALGILKDNPKADCFRLYPCPGPDVKVTDDYGLIATDAPYRVSCQAAIWRVELLKWLLSRFNDPRAFEIQGTTACKKDRSDRLHYAVREPDPNKWPLQYYCTAIVRGLYDINAVEFCQAHNVPVDLSRRSVFRGPS